MQYSSAYWRMEKGQPPYKATFEILIINKVNQLMLASDDNSV